MSKFTEADAIQLLREVLGYDVESSLASQGKSIPDITLADLSFDSLSILEFAILLEERCSMVFNPSDLDLTVSSTLTDLVSVVNRGSSKS